MLITNVSYEDFDFHAKCHGMKWENISELVDRLNLDGMGYLWTLQNDVIRDQTGAFRIKWDLRVMSYFRAKLSSCIDCLDRTNVVQSAIARRVLSSMLTQLGLVVIPATSDIENVFSDGKSG